MTNVCLVRGIEEVQDDILKDYRDPLIAHSCGPSNAPGAFHVWCRVKFTGCLKLQLLNIDPHYIPWGN